MATLRQLGFADARAFMRTNLVQGRKSMFRASSACVIVRICGKQKRKTMRAMSSNSRIAFRPTFSCQVNGYADREIEL
jgi:hypothetical protein